jgi:hypothetical protein
MSCGCGHVHERHKNGDITMEDLQRAASNHGLSVQQAAQNIERSARQTAGAGASGGTGAQGGSSTRGTAAQGEGVSAHDTPNM